MQFESNKKYVRMPMQEHVTLHTKVVNIYLDIQCAKNEITGVRRSGNAARDLPSACHIPCSHPHDAKELHFRQIMSTFMYASRHNLQTEKHKYKDLCMCASIHNSKNKREFPD